MNISIKHIASIEIIEPCKRIHPIVNFFGKPYVSLGLLKYEKLSTFQKVNKFWSYDNKHAYSPYFVRVRMSNTFCYFIPCETCKGAISQQNELLEQIKTIEL